MHTLLYTKPLLQSNLQGSSVDDVLDLQHYVVTPPSAIHFFQESILPSWQRMALKQERQLLGQKSG